MPALPDGIACEHDPWLGVSHFEFQGRSSTSRAEVLRWYAKWRRRQLFAAEEGGSAAISSPTGRARAGGGASAERPPPTVVRVRSPRHIRAGVNNYVAPRAGSTAPMFNDEAARRHDLGLEDLTQVLHQEAKNVFSDDPSLWPDLWRDAPPAAGEAAPAADHAGPGAAVTASPSRMMQRAAAEFPSPVPAATMDHVAEAPAGGSPPKGSPAPSRASGPSRATWRRRRGVPAVSEAPGARAPPLPERQPLRQSAPPPVRQDDPSALKMSASGSGGRESRVHTPLQAVEAPPEAAAAPVDSPSGGSGDSSSLAAVAAAAQSAAARLTERIRSDMDRASQRLAAQERRLEALGGRARQATEGVTAAHRRARALERRVAELHDAHDAQLGEIQGMWQRHEADVQTRLGALERENAVLRQGLGKGAQDGVATEREEKAGAGGAGFRQGGGDAGGSPPPTSLTATGPGPTCARRRSSLLSMPTAATVVMNVTGLARRRHRRNEVTAEVLGSTHATHAPTPATLAHTQPAPQPAPTDSPHPAPTAFLRSSLLSHTVSFAGFASRIATPSAMGRALAAAHGHQPYTPRARTRTRQQRSWFEHRPSGAGNAHFRALEGPTAGEGCREQSGAASASSADSSSAEGAEQEGEEEEDLVVTDASSVDSDALSSSDPASEPASPDVGAPPPAAGPGGAGREADALWRRAVGADPARIPASALTQALPRVAGGEGGAPAPRPEPLTVPSPSQPLQAIPSPSPPGSARPEAPTPGDRHFLRRVLRKALPFAHLDGFALRTMARGFSARDVAAGETLLRRDEPTSACFVVARGELRLHRDVAHAPAGEGAGEGERLRRGQLIGETALLHGWRAPFTAVAVQPSQVWTLTRTSYRSLARDALEQWRALLIAQLRLVPALSAVADGTLAALCDAMEERSLAVGAAPPRGALAIVVRGALEVQPVVAPSDPEARGWPLRLGAGDFVGATTLSMPAAAADEAASLSVAATAREPSTILALSWEACAEVMASVGAGGEGGSPLPPPPPPCPELHSSQLGEFDRWPAAARVAADCGPFSVWLEEEGKGEGKGRAMHGTETEVAASPDDSAGASVCSHGSAPVPQPLLRLPLPSGQRVVCRLLGIRERARRVEEAMVVADSVVWPPLPSSTPPPSVAGRALTSSASSASSVTSVAASASSATSAPGFPLASAGPPAAASHASTSVAPLADEVHVPFHDLRVVRRLGNGAFGSVWLVHAEPTRGGAGGSGASWPSAAAAARRDGLFALKCMRKAGLFAAGVTHHAVHERALLGAASHPFLCSLHAAYQDERWLYLLLSLGRGGEVFSLLEGRDNGRLREDEAQFVAACVVEALDALHGRGIAYRDLKVRPAARLDPRPPAYARPPVRAPQCGASRRMCS